MKRVVFAALIAACGSNAEDPARTPRPLVFERWSPPQASSSDRLVGASGSIIVMANWVSRDGGATWAALDPRLGQPSRVAFDGTNVYLYVPSRGLTRLDVETGEITAIPGAPAFANDRTWRLDRGSGQLVAFDPVENAIAVQGASGWVTAELPRPAANEVPNINDLDSNRTTMLVVSGWGVHRSRDGGATWQLAAAGLDRASRDLLVLPDERFLLVGGETSYLFTASGEPAGTVDSLMIGGDEATVCDDGSLVAGGNVSHDLGASWQPLVPTSGLDIVVERASCGAGSYWAQVRSPSWGYRLLRYGAVGAPGVAAGNWDAVGPQAWGSRASSIVRTADGTFLAGGYAWRDGDAGWTMRDMPGDTWTSRGLLFGLEGKQFYLSSDAGVTWKAIAGAGLGATEPASFARGPDGALYVGELVAGTQGATETRQATVWRSADLGATWSVAYSGLVTRTNGGTTETGEAHLFVGITDDGTWIATDAVSSDAGVTWKRAQAVGDRSLAHLMPDGSLVMQPADASGEIWRVYADGGMGDLLATHAIEADGQPVLAAGLRSVAFDDDGHAYVACGTPHTQIWRSTTPLQLPTAAE